MSRKLIMGFGIVLIIALAYLAYFFFYQTRQASPFETALYDSGDVNMSIEYSRPSKKGRVIFAASEDALQPFGEYWRLGANKATKFTTNVAVTVGGQTLEPGSYQMYAIPGPDTWTIGINANADRWGATPPDYDEDVFRFEVQAESTDGVVEMLSIGFDEGQESGVVNIVVQWDMTRLVIPVGFQ